MKSARDLKDLSADVIHSILLRIDNRKVHCFDSSVALPFLPSTLWIVEKGGVSLAVRKRPLSTFSSGEIVGLWLGDEVFGDSHVAGLSLEIAEDEARLIECPLKDVEDFFRAHPDRIALWNEFLCASSRNWFRRFVEEAALALPPTPQYKHYGNGETIIEEGDRGNEVFVLEHGLAAASVEGTFVGEVREGEIFGALSVLTEAPRGATVQAKEACDCAVFSGADFKMLLRTQPELFSQFISDLARVLRDVNLSVSKTVNTTWRNLF